MNNISNLESYDGVESIQLNRFSRDELIAYFNNKMESARNNVEFIKQYIFKGEPLRICEIGSGNSKLLYALEADGILGGGIGYEVSHSRHELAEKFRDISNSSHVKNVCADFLKAEPDEYDLIVGVDIVMQIISPLYDDAERDLMEKVVDSLNDGGCLFLELEDYTPTIEEIQNAGGVIQKWEEFDKSDPFQYSLNRISMDNDNHLVYEKVFIPRNDGTERSYFKNVIKNYTRGEIVDILNKHGLSAEIYSMQNENIEDTKNGSNFHDCYRVLARKNM